MLTTTDVTLRFADGIEHRIAVAPGQAILDVGLEAGAPLLYQCRSGTCSSCVARLVSGEAHTRAGQSTTLTASERDRGHRLLCVSEAASDCTFELEYDSTAGAMAPIEGNAFVNAVERIASDVVRLELELAEGSWIEFRPGQFIQIEVPGAGVERRYSMASTPADLPKLELLIRLLPGGAMSQWLLDEAKRDDVLKISGAYGSFFLREDVRAPHIMIAGGTGLAPMLSMIDAIRARPGRKPRVLLSFGCASPEGLFALDTLELRRLWLPALETRISIDRGEGPDGVRTGNPVESVTADDIVDADTVAYLCGPPGMIEAAHSYLAALGVRPDNIHAEQFVASE